MLRYSSRDQTFCPMNYKGALHVEINYKVIGNSGAIFRRTSD